jgi:hypothetical protein
VKRKKDSYFSQTETQYSEQVVSRPINGNYHLGFAARDCVFVYTFGSQNQRPTRQPSKYLLSTATLPSASKATSQNFLIHRD